MKKNIEKVKHKKLLTFLLVSVFTLAFACPVFASDGSTVSTKTYKFTVDKKDYVITAPVDLVKGYPYIYVKKYKYSSSTYSTQVYFVDKKLYASDTGSHPLLNIDGSNIHWKMFYSFDLYNVNLVNVNPDNYGSWSSKTIYNGSGSSCMFTDGFLYSNTNINYVHLDDDSKEYTVKSDSFFIPPVPPVAQAAVELPAVVQGQTKTILPIAVSCLALLIGSLTLLPRLRIFLH